MNPRNPPASPRADRIRRAFDASFAEPAAPPRPAAARLLLVQVGDTACAIPMAECAGIAPAAGITRLPARHRAFRGLAAVAGSVLPVYDLATAVGFRPDADAPWLLIAAGPHPVAFLVSAVEGHAELEPSLDVAGANPVVSAGGAPRHVVRLAVVADAIARDATLSSRS